MIYTDIKASIAHREPYTASNSHALRVGDPETIELNSGEAPPEAIKELQDALGQDTGYLVFSYSTPVALFTASGKISVPDQKYSSTTSKLQKICRESV